MLDDKQSGALDRSGSRKWFRCLGWCIPERDLDDVLDEVDVEDLPSKKRERKPIRLRGPWSFQRVCRAHELLCLRKPNGNITELHKALAHLACMVEDAQGTMSTNTNRGRGIDPLAAQIAMSHAEFHKICMGSLGGMFTKDEFKNIVESIWLWKGAPAVRLDKVVQRILERIISPPSALDLPPEAVGIPRPP